MGGRADRVLGTSRRRPVDPGELTRSGSARAGAASGHNRPPALQIIGWRFACRPEDTRARFQTPGQTDRVISQLPEGRAEVL
jgi:hypothetical protein